MKCACEYEYEFDYAKTQVTKGDEDFILVNVVATVSQEYTTDTTVTTVRIYACPKCGTLKIGT